jgi:hypothetical protein
MRRVIDDTCYEVKAKEIAKVISSIPADEVSKYDYGTYRAQRSMIIDRILKEIKNIKLGKDMNTTGIGNNWCRELIYTGNEKEEQVFGVIHSTNNMFGSEIVWVSDYDGNRCKGKRQIHGCDPNSKYQIQMFRWA